MDPSTADRLIELNREFYTTFGPAFAATRRRIQEGVRRALGSLPIQGGTWLDVGCGSGSLAVEWLRMILPAAYLGVDFSPALLAEATSAVQSDLGYAQERVSFAQVNLANSNWSSSLRSAAPFAGAFAFAVLHHLPSDDLRARALRHIHNLLTADGWFVHSEWQFYNAPRLVERVLPWQTVGLDESQLDPGDTLLDWRYALPGQAEQRGLRYVHRFSPEELTALAHRAGFVVRETYESDGQGGRLGLYQIWQKAG